MIAKTVGPLAPTVTLIFNAIKRASSEYIVDWNGDSLYQVNGPFQDQCVVNIDRRACYCRKWELTGIPCKHVVVAIHNKSCPCILGVIILENWVYAAYRLETWAHVYSFKVIPCNGRDTCPIIESRIIILPPIYKTQVGRPPKKMKKSVDELASQSFLLSKLYRKGKSVKCSKCRNLGHNRKGYKGQVGASQAGGSSQQSATPSQAASARNSSSQANGYGQPSA
nr:hypothetical protein [Tanacetum cinerariifolium]